MAETYSEETDSHANIEASAPKPEIKDEESFSEQSKGMYLDTIDRQRLDFDFEKLCTVSLSNINVYGCLVCGKYYQGRGQTSHAFFHSIHEEHHVFINLTTLKVYILPDGYEVHDASLEDIKYVIQPTFTKEQVVALANTSPPKFSFDLSNKKYLPGYVGLNNIKSNDYINVIIQALVHVPPIRDFLPLEQIRSLFFSTRKIWNPKAFKGLVSPHELLQEISNASDKQFKITTQVEPVQFLSWFLHRLHRDLGGSKKRESIITRTFQGDVHTNILTMTNSDTMSYEERRSSATSKFYFLTLDLPPPPLFSDEMEENIIPQIPLSKLLEKFNGVTKQETGTEIRKYSLHHLPPYLILYIKRFGKNNWSTEKNPTIVNFPIQNLSLVDIISEAGNKTNIEDLVKYNYNLLSNISCQGGKEPGEGQYFIHNYHPGLDQWFQIQDLTVTPALHQMLFLSESYLQIWERKDVIELPVIAKDPEMPSVSAQEPDTKRAKLSD
ncbi:Ubiquitin carboxyl-terminal hydrolase 10 [Entomophthora muscae]|uniref:Ubiquitin carboxyl-terminal hydrolase 10 n=1 Tax=Entomophthora muscae TaxID=34485 RepID=A0ACC2U4P3_9FUNG|nr:Ubiquitin carboxyl-terminal hydrolase 10 [Entomophthora muscae]